MLNKKPVALAILELFTAVYKFKMSHELVFDRCDPVLHSLIVLPIGNVRTKFESVVVVIKEI